MKRIRMSLAFEGCAFGCLTLGVILYYILYYIILYYIILLYLILYSSLLLICSPSSFSPLPSISFSSSFPSLPCFYPPISILFCSSLPSSSLPSSSSFLTSLPILISSLPSPLPRILVGTWIHLFIFWRF